MTSSGLVHITNASVSSASTIDVDSCFSTTYRHYLIKLNLDGAAATVAMLMRASGVTATASNYGRQYISVDGSGTSVGRSSSQASWSPAGETETASKNQTEIWVYSPFVSNSMTLANIVMSGNNNADTINYVDVLFTHNVVTSYDGFRLTLSSGTVSGTVSVFGLALS